LGLALIPPKQISVFGGTEHSSAPEHVKISSRLKKKKKKKLIKI
jgi:hypothetical protein